MGRIKKDTILLVSERDNFLKILELLLKREVQCQSSPLSNYSYIYIPTYEEATRLLDEYKVAGNSPLAGIFIGERAAKSNLEPETISGHEISQEILSRHLRVPIFVLNKDKITENHVGSTYYSRDYPKHTIRYFRLQLRPF